ncbi:MAG: hypothetical protein JWL70_2868, partial [Acidimicrobiia bacterium]|nr:hypothetical protein [Acidimicrobiia bacterium]
EVSQSAAIAGQALGALHTLDGRILDEPFLQQAQEFAQVVGGPPVDAWNAAAPTPYVNQLALLAVYVGEHSGVNPQQLLAVWVKTDSRRMVAVLTALAQIGTPYRAGGQRPGGFDCSGLVGYAWSQAGVGMPRNSEDIIRALRSVSQDQLQPGDVVWRRGHVQMYLGLGDATVQSPHTGATVEVTTWGRVSRFGSPL